MNMKKLVCILLMLLLPFSALSEAAVPLAPYALTAPEDTECVPNEEVVTYVRDTSRVVVQSISRIPDESPAEALIRLMGQFDAEAVIGDALTLAADCVGLTATHADQFGEGVDVQVVMVLSAQGDLLILSAYDMAGDEDSAALLLDALLDALTLNGVSVRPAADVSAG